MTTNVDEAVAEIAENTQHTERAERPVLIREFNAADMRVDGRTVDVRLVPFGEIARVADPPDWKPYQEEWLAGVFDHQLNAANRIHARYGHSQSVVDVVGHGLELRREADGYHLSTKILDTIQGETALELLRGDALPCVSLEAHPIKSMRTATGVVQRIKANLTGFAFCRQGAFAGARVLAIREEIIDEILIPAEFQPIPFDPDLAARLERAGHAVPASLKAHPAQTDTPAETGTSADGTRPPTESVT